MPEQSNDYRAVVFGSGAVGKTSLILRFVRGTFRESYTPTVEDTYRVVLQCDKNVCTLEITDTSGTYPFPAMHQLAISRGHAFVLVYSVTTRQSIENLKYFYDQIKQHKKDLQQCPVMLVGNKCDENERNVSTEEGQNLARFWGCGFIETSAKTNYNVREMFKNLLSLETRQKLSLNDDVGDGKRKSENHAEKLRRRCCSVS